MDIVDHSRLVSLSNQAKIERSDGNDHPGRAYAKDFLIRSAKSLKPTGIDIEHQGSFAVHMYSQYGTDNFIFTVQCVGLQDLPEAQVDVGLKELRRQLMAVYGREDKTRNKI